MWRSLIYWVAVAFRAVAEYLGDLQATTATWFRVTAGPSRSEQSGVSVTRFVTAVVATPNAIAFQYIIAVQITRRPAQ